MEILVESAPLDAIRIICEFINAQNERRSGKKQWKHTTSENMLQSMNKLNDCECCIRVMPILIHITRKIWKFSAWCAPKMYILHFQRPSFKIEMRHRHRNCAMILPRKRTWIVGMQCAPVECFLAWQPIDSHLNYGRYIKLRFRNVRAKQ